MLPNPSLALQAFMAREVSFPNGASAAGGRTDLKLQQTGGGGLRVCFDRIYAVGDGKVSVRMIQRGRGLG